MTYHFCSDCMARFGISCDEAVMLYNIRWWVAKNTLNGMNSFEGRYWTYNSIPAFAGMFSFMTQDQVRRAIANLIQKGAILVSSFNQDGRDRTRWYTVTSECNCVNPHMQVGKPPDVTVNPPMHLAKPPHASGETPTCTTSPYTDNKQTDKEREQSMLSLEPPKPNTPNRETIKPCKARGFVKPTLEEVAAYCKERGNGIDPEAFIAHYEMVGWVTGRSSKPMVSWRGAVGTWEAHRREKARGAPIRPTVRATVTSAPPPPAREAPKDYVVLGVVVPGRIPRACLDDSSAAMVRVSAANYDPADPMLYVRSRQCREKQQAEAAAATGKQV